MVIKTKDVDYEKNSFNSYKGFAARSCGVDSLLQAPAWLMVLQNS